MPEVLSHLEFLENYAFAEAGLPELKKYFEQAIKIAHRLSELHFLILWPAKLAVSEFDNFYKELFTPADPFGPYENGAEGSVIITHDTR